MDKIFVKLFNVPSVSRNGEKINFPSRKVEALFYYLVVNKEVGRDEAAALLWPEADSEAGRKNLRNAVYYIKKSFDSDIVVSPKKSTLMLSPDIDLHSDIDMLTENQWFEAYTGEFMQGFIVKEEEALETWIENCRDKYKGMYIQKLYEKLKANFETGNYSEVEQVARRLTEIDQYDEKAYRALMKAYASMGHYNKAIDAYNRLAELLRKDLGIVPDIKSRTLYNKVTESRNREEAVSDISHGRFFYGRKQELDKLQMLYNCFISGKASSSPIIIGEAGIGKTELKDRFLEFIRKGETVILESNCFQVEEELPLKPWSVIFEGMQQIIEDEDIKVPELWREELSGLYSHGSGLTHNVDGSKFRIVEDRILNLLKKICKTKRVVLVFDDIQWMDGLSLKLLTGMLLHLNKEVFSILTCRNGFSPKIDSFITELAKYERLSKFELERFNREETADFIKEALPDNSLSVELVENIYKETEGNTFFMVEYLNSLRENSAFEVMSTKMEDILKSRFVGVSEAGLKLVNIVSMFYDEAPLEILAEISGLDDMELLDVLDDLKFRYIVKEARDRNKLSIEFTHQKLREFIYNQLSEARKQVIHGRIGKSLQARLLGDDRDIRQYPKLVYHFRNGGSLLSALKYSIKSANYYLDFYHELFPVLSKGLELESSSTVLGSEAAMGFLDEIEELLRQIKEAHPATEELVALETAFYHLKGRYLIRQGDYENGVALVEQMMSIAAGCGLPEYVLKGHRQMIYYGIQTRNPALMNTHIEAGLELSASLGYYEDNGMFLRLKGLYCIINREYGRAEELLKQCIEKFLSIKDAGAKYSMHIAGAYSYIGDIRRYGMKFKSSLEYYDKAIELCERSKVFTSLTVFCTHAGQAAFDAGDYRTARTYFERALKTYRQADSIWGRGIAEAYMALLYIREGKYEEALHSLKRADKYTGMLKNPYELGLIYRIKAELRHNMGPNKKLAAVFGGYLDKATAYYCDEAFELLKEVNDSYQLDIVKLFYGG